MDPNLISQFGLPIAYTIVLTVVVRFLYKREADGHAAELQRERERSDRLEEELRGLNATVRDRMVPALVDSNRVTAEATRAMGEVTAVIALTRRQP